MKTKKAIEIKTDDLKKVSGGVERDTQKGKEITIPAS